MGSGGLRVDYGGGITRRLDTVVRQNLLWGAKQASIAYNEMIGEELGCDGIEIDYHSNPRPSHAFMQGKQYVLGKARKCNGIYFESADEALERLEDYNCYHYKTPIICGISEPRYSEKELAELKARDERTFNINGHEMTGYEASQAMRRLETAVREQKGIKAMAQASGDKLAVRECNERIKRYKDKYAEISDITGIAQDKKRMTLTKSGTSGIISSEKEYSPRKNKTADYSVKWDKVQTSEYENKFSQLTKDEKVSNSVKTRANWCLNNRDGENTEEIYAVSLKDGREIGRITDQAEEYGVVRTKAFDTALKNADEANENVLLLHNHPRGLPPSISDINALLKNKNVSGITIGHDGSMYYYTRPSKEIQQADYQVLLRKFKQYSDVTSMEKALEELQGKYSFEIKKL